MLPFFPPFQVQSEASQKKPAKPDESKNHPLSRGTLAHAFLHSVFFSLWPSSGHEVGARKNNKKKNDALYPMPYHHLPLTQQPYPESLRSFPVNLSFCSVCIFRSFLFGHRGSGRIPRNTFSFFQQKKSCSFQVWAYFLVEKKKHLM